MSSEPSRDLERFGERITVLRAQAGDRAAFDELVDAYQERLMYFVHRLVQDAHQSSDILQEVWLDVFRTLGRLQAPAAFRVWLYRIARNRAVTYLRRRKSYGNVVEQLGSDVLDAPDPVNEMELLDNAQLVHFALDKLSMIQREVMTLRFLEDMDVSEIARVMDCSEGTAKSRLHYAKLALRQIIEEEQGRG